VCGIVLFRAAIVLFVAVRVVLVVGTCCTSVVSATHICNSPGVDVWAPTKTSLTKIYLKKKSTLSKFCRQTSTLNSR
jgi:hypothetical protein